VSSHRGVGPMGRRLCLLRCFSYPVQSDRRCSQTLCTGHGRLNTVSPRPDVFSPQTPPVVGHAVGAMVHLCSFASSIILLRPTFDMRTCRALDLWPSPTGSVVDDSRSPLKSPLRGRFPYKEFAYMRRFSGSAGSVRHSR
jgi:hypothetical protein